MSSALPLEMLTLVFAFVVRRHLDNKDGARPPALCLRLVCRLWRDAFNAEPNLWKIIPLQSTTIAQEILSRCRTRPLLVCLRGRSNGLNSTTKREALDLVLRQHSQQIGALSFVDLAKTDAAYGPAVNSLQAGSFPALTFLELLRVDLRLRDGLFAGPIPPRLRTLRFDVTGGGLHYLPAAPLIETIEVDGIYAKNLFWALQGTSPSSLLPTC